MFKITNFISKRKVLQTRTCVVFICHLFSLRNFLLFIQQNFPDPSDIFSSSDWNKPFFQGPLVVFDGKWCVENRPMNCQLLLPLRSQPLPQNGEGRHGYKLLSAVSNLESNAEDGMGELQIATSLRGLSEWEQLRACLSGEE